MAFSSDNIERKELAILRILRDSAEPVGARVIAHRLKDHGFELGERTVRYHLKIFDERGLTYLVGKRDGRVLTDKGMAEVQSALVQDKVGFTISRIETLSFRTTYDWRTRTGLVPVNVSFFRRDDFEKALRIMKPVFDAGICTSDLVAVASEGKQLGEISVPQGMVGLATVCSIIFNGVLLKAGVPVDSRFGGILEYRGGKPRRFVELIDYAGCSLDPSTIFIKARMTGIAGAAGNGDGRVLANFREIPSICRSAVNEAISVLQNTGFNGPILVGETSEPLCELPVGQNKIGVVLLGGLNPVAAAEEGGIVVEDRAMSTVMEYHDLVPFRDAVIEFRDLVKFWNSSR